jgi:hypothetical protein
MLKVLIISTEKNTRSLESMNPLHQLIWRRAIIKISPSMDKYYV